VKVQTVTGEIGAEELGVTLPHEHLLFDLSCFFVMPEEATGRRLAQNSVEISNLGEIKRNPLANKDNLVNYDVELAIAELSYFKRAGGRSIVDLTNVGLGRDPAAVRAISLQTGIQVVLGSGYYVAASHPRRVASMTTDEIANEITRDVEEGIGGTGIRSGVIGEIGTSWPLAPDEEKVLRAAARAQLKTGLSVNIHSYCGQSLDDVKVVHRLLDIVEDEGIQLDRVILSHMDIVGIDVEVHDSLAKRGAFISYDCFGSEMYFDNNWRWEPRDTERIRGIRDLVKRGHLPKLLISHDVCYKVHFRRFGGYGYDHILTHVAPMMRSQGVTEREIEALLVANPARALTGE
jgi:phosphotriesterase-related protein